MRVALTGASGVLGRFLAADLKARGCELRAWQGRRILPPGVAPVPGRLGDAAAARRLCDGADLLVHAALAHLPGRYRGGEGVDPRGFVSTNLEGSLELLRIAREAGVARAVVLSSRAVLDGLERDMVDDTAPVRPTTLYGAVKAGLEAFVSALGHGEGWHVAALRPTGIYGVIEPVEESKWFGLIAEARAGRLPAEDRMASEVHGADVADAVWRLASRDEARGRVFNCSDVVVSRRQVLELAGITADLPPARPPARIMSCGALRSLGWRPGGRERLARTVRALVSATGERADAQP